MENKKEKKFLIIGGSAGGSTIGANLRRLDDFSKITIVEKDPDVSFSNCSLPYYFSGEVESIEDLIVNTPEDFKRKYNIDVRVHHQAMKINRDQKYVEIKDLNTKETYKEAYDYLIITTGGSPNKPKDLLNENVFTLRNVQDVRDIDKFLKENKVENVGIIGNGYIGVEVGEAFRLSGKNVKLFGSRNQVLMPFDEDMAQIIHKELIDNGMDLILGTRVKNTSKDGIFLDDGTLIPCDLVILSIGIKPDNHLAKEAGLEIGKTGGIVVDSNNRTSDESIYALGDVVEVHNDILNKPDLLALAGPAHKQADIAANHIYNNQRRNKGVIKSAILRVFDLNCGTVGLNERNLQEEEIGYDFVFGTYQDKIHEGKKIHLKVLFEKITGQILGAQIIGQGEITKRLDTISTLISQKGDLYDLWENELAYSPIYSTTKDATNIIGSMGLGLLNKEYEKVSISMIRSLVEEDALIIDTRSTKEFEKGHIIKSKNIPIGLLRDKVEELPKDENIYINSYSAMRILKQRGFKAIYIEGDFEDLCLHEYYKDLIENREKIVSEYRF